MKTAIILAFFLFLLFPLSGANASEKTFSKSEACLMEDGEYGFENNTYYLLEVSWKKGEAKAYGFTKHNNMLYYGVIVTEPGKKGHDSYLFSYSCKTKIPKVVYFVGNQSHNRIGIFVSSIGDERFFSVWGGVISGGGMDMGVLDTRIGRYYDVFSFPEFRNLYEKCDYLGRCFRGFIVEKGVLYVNFAIPDSPDAVMNRPANEKIVKYKINLNTKKLYKQ